MNPSMVMNVALVLLLASEKRKVVADDTGVANVTYSSRTETG